MYTQFFERTVRYSLHQMDSMNSFGPPEIEYSEMAKEARKKMFDIAGCFNCQKFNDQSLIRFGIGGRVR